MTVLGLNNYSYLCWFYCFCYRGCRDGKVGWFVEGIIASARIHFLTLHMCLVELGCNAECIFLECDLRYHESSPITLTVKCWGGPAPSLFSVLLALFLLCFFPRGVGFLFSFYPLLFFLAFCPVSPLLLPCLSCLVLLFLLDHSVDGLNCYHYYH